MIDSVMPEGLDARINLPLTTAMYAAIKKRAVDDGVSAVGFIRRCINEGLNNSSKINDLEKRLAEVEDRLRKPAPIFQIGARVALC